MQTTKINKFSFIRWADLKPLLASFDKVQFDEANKVLTNFNIDANALDELIDELNIEYKNWHFYLESCSIKRAREKSSVILNNLSSLKVIQTYNTHGKGDENILIQS